MIVEQEIPIHNRKTLNLAREYLRRRSANEMTEIHTHLSEFKHKWTLSRITYVLSKGFVASAIGSGLGTVIASLMGTHRAGRGKTVKGWRLMLFRAIEKTIVPLIRKMV